MSDREFHPMAQMSALCYFVKTYLQPDMELLEPEIIQQLKNLAENPDIDIKSIALMSLHLARGHSEEIKKYLREQLKLLGENEIAIRARWAIAIDYLGFLYSQKGNFANALLAHKKALQVRPDDAVALVNLGLAYGNSGDMERAIGALQRAYESDSTYTVILKNLGYAYLQIGEIDNAISAYEKAIKMKPYDPTAHILLAQVYNNTGRQQEAITVLQAAQKRLPDDESILQALQPLGAR